MGKGKGASRLYLATLRHDESSTPTHLTLLCCIARASRSPRSSSTLTFLRKSALRTAPHFRRHHTLASQATTVLIAACSSLRHTAPCSHPLARLTEGITCLFTTRYPLGRNTKLRKAESMVHYWDARVPFWCIPPPAPSPQHLIYRCLSLPQHTPCLLSLCPGTFAPSSQAPAANRHVTPWAGTARALRPTSRARRCARSSARWR